MSSIVVQFDNLTVNVVKGSVYCIVSKRLHTATNAFHIVEATDFNLVPGKEAVIFQDAGSGSWEVFATGKKLSAA